MRSTTSHEPVGKTTLLSAWLDKTEHAYAWATLDRLDNEPIRFLTYLTAALSRLNDAFGDVLAGSLEDEPPPYAGSSLNKRQKQS